jgi:hypothetical protein
MKHATAPILDRLEPFLAEIRKLGTLKEKTRGVFYRRSHAALHFHEDPKGIFADLRVSADWHRVPVNTAAERAALLRALNEPATTKKA